MLKTNMVVNHTFYIPLIAAYSGVLTRCVVLLVSYYKYAQPKLQTETPQEKVCQLFVVGFWLQLHDILTASAINFTEDMVFTSFLQTRQRRRKKVLP